MTTRQYLNKIAAEMIRVDAEYAAGLLTTTEYADAMLHLDRCERDPHGLETFAGE
jgi:hypothetical protein